MLSLCTESFLFSVPLLCLKGRAPELEKLLLFQPITTAAAFTEHKQEPEGPLLWSQNFTI
jgi:hypothetical protein